MSLNMEIIRESRECFSVAALSSPDPLRDLHVWTNIPQRDPTTNAPAPMRTGFQCRRARGLSDTHEV